MHRVAVFIDWQNTYHWARRAFHAETDPGWRGQIRPRALAELLVSKGPAGRELAHLAIYTGRPDPRIDPKTSAAHMRQCAAWERDCGGLLTLRTRTLRYPPGWPRAGRAEEKGIDVQLAIDAMVMAIRNEYDTAILVTADSDHLPVVEALQALKAASGVPEVEVVGWGGVSQKLDVPGAPVRWIGPLDYKAVQDTTDYNIKPAGR